MAILPVPVICSRIRKYVNFFNGRIRKKNLSLFLQLLHVFNMPWRTFLLISEIETLLTNCISPASQTTM